MWLRLALVSGALVLLGTTAWQLRGSVGNDENAAVTNKNTPAEKPATAKTEDTSLLKAVSGDAPDDTKAVTRTTDNVKDEAPNAEPARQAQGNDNSDDAPDSNGDFVGASTRSVTAPGGGESKKNAEASSTDRSDQPESPPADNRLVAGARVEDVHPAPAPVSAEPASDSQHPSSAAVDEARVVEDRGLDGSLKGAPSCELVLGGATFEATRNTDYIRLTAKRAETALRNGNVKRAHAIFCEASALGPNDYRSAMGMATLLLIRRDAEASEKWARLALKVSASHPRRAKHALADALVRLGRVQEAQTLWLEAAQDPNPEAEQLDAYVARTQERARSALKHYDYHRAERLYRRTIALQPTNKHAIGQLAQTLRRLKEYEAATYWEAKAR